MAALFVATLVPLGVKLVRLYDDVLGYVALSAAGAACVLALGLAVALMRSMHRRIGCEPAYAAWIASKIAAGNLNIDIQLRPADRTSLLAGIAAMRDSLKSLVRDARSGADAVANASSELANGSLSLSSRISHQVDRTMSTAAAMEQLTSTVEANATNVGRANSLAQASCEAALQGGSVVSQVIETMNGIHASSHQIVEITGVIDEIARRTNILAINATVEAAHAGDKGRGFAIVAAEVRELSQRTAHAAQQIKTLIDAANERIARGATLADQAGQRMRQIVDGVQQVTAVIGDIKAATEQQACGLSEVNDAINEMDALSQETASLVRESAAAADAMQDQAGTLAQAVSIFKTGDTVLDVPTRHEVARARAGAGGGANGFDARIIRFGFGLEPDSSQGRAAREFARDLAARTEGRLKLKEFGSATLGNDEQMQEALKSGSLEMMVATTSTLVRDVPEFGLFDVPFLFADESEADAILDGPIGRGIADKLEPKGLVGLVFWESGFRNLTNSKKPVKKLEDLRGLKLRVMPNPIHTEVFRALGADPVALPFAELFLALETGKVDGQENPLTTIESSRFYSVQKHFSLTRHIYTPWIVTASRTWWESLSEQERQAVRASAAHARDFQRKDSRGAAPKALAFLEQQGMTITRLTDDALKAMRERAQQAIRQSAHAGLVQQVRDALGRP